MRIKNRKILRSLRVANPHIDGHEMALALSQNGTQDNPGKLKCGRTFVKSARGDKRWVAARNDLLSRSS